MITRSQALILATAAALELALAGLVPCPAAEVEPKTPAPARRRGPLSDDGKTMATIAEVPILKIEPPEKGFFAKELDYHGLPIKGAAVVSDAAFYEAWRRVDNLLRHNPMILQNLLRAGSEVHIIGKDQAQTDLPEFRGQKGVPLRENPRITLDERARGMGGRECSCGEENLLKLPRDRYRGRDILSHEFTHTIHGYGVSQNVRELVTKTYRSAREKKLWETPGGTPIYAGSNENEYLAELALWYVGGRGDWPRSMPPMQPGPEFIKKYDPEGYKLVDDLFSGRLDVQPLSANLPAATPVDIFQDMESGNNGDPLSSAVMNASSHGGGSTWTVERGRMWVSVSHHRDLPGPVLVGGETFSGKGGSRSWAVNDSRAANYVVGSLPGSYSKLTVACHYIPGATDVRPYNTFDHIVVLGDGVFMCMGLTYQGGDKGVGLNLAVESCVEHYKSRNSPPIYPIVAGRAYWINMHFDGPAGVSCLAVYDADNGYAQVGRTVQAASLKNSKLSRGVRIGRADSHGDNVGSTAKTYFDNIIIDYTNAAFPLIPGDGHKTPGEKQADPSPPRDSSSFTRGR